MNIHVSNQNTAQQPTHHDNLRQQYQELRKQLEVDPYSGLPLRRKFDRTLTAHLAHMKKAGEIVGGVLVIRLSGLLQQAGTTDYFYPLLVRIVSNIREMAPEQLYQSDRIEELLIFFPQSRNTQMLHDLASKICDTITNDSVLSEVVSVRTLFYAGIYQFEWYDLTPNIILQKCYYAVAEAEQLRSKMALYTEKIAQSYLRREEVGREIAKLVNNGFKGLQLYYQPIFNNDGYLCGAEALLRWFHPDIGEISPQYFVPLAENNGYIASLDRWVVYQVMASRSRLNQKMQQPLSYFINLSAQRFMQPSFLNQVMELIKDYNVADKVMFEITERSAMQDPESATTIIQNLKQMNIGVILDDFGTGYSSLSYLGKFNVDIIKIDRSFVSDVVSDTNRQAIIEHIINLANRIQIQVLVEGVEKTAEMQYLKKLDCQMYQGFLFSRPLPEDEFINFLEQTPHIQFA